MPIPIGQSCASCTFMDYGGPYQFYGKEVLVNGIQIGWCRRSVPRPAQTPSQTASGAFIDERKDYILGVEWPEVLSSDWCGEWGGPP